MGESVGSGIGISRGVGAVGSGSVGKTVGKGIGRGVGAIGSGMGKRKQ